ncbi:MAG: hypothetical protein COC24_018135, partial [Alphaproteobacteria bacterium]|nr:hypothetical protein [Alphaproteobacteria bacterium]
MSFGLDLAFSLGFRVVDIASLPPAYEPAWLNQFDILPQDDQGWTVISLEDDAKVHYVSNSGDDTAAAALGGYDATAFPDMLNPPASAIAWSTVSSAVAAMRDDEADAVLLKAGESHATSVRQNLPTGKSAIQRHLISRYGSGANPIIAAAQGLNQIFRFWHGGGNINVMHV